MYLAESTLLPSVKLPITFGRHNCTYVFLLECGLFWFDCNQNMGNMSTEQHNFQLLIFKIIRRPIEIRTVCE